MNLQFHQKDFEDFISLADFAYSFKKGKQTIDRKSQHYRTFVAGLVDITMKACDSQILNCSSRKHPSISKDSFNSFCGELQTILEKEGIPLEKKELFAEWKKRIGDRFGDKELMRISGKEFSGKISSGIEKPPVSKLPEKLYGGPFLSPLTRQHLYFYHTTKSEGGVLYWSLAVLNFSHESRIDPDKLVTSISMPNYTRTKIVDYVVTITRELFTDNLQLKIRHGLEPSNDAVLDNMKSHDESVAGTMYHLDWQDRWRLSKCILSSILLTNENETGPLLSDQYLRLEELWQDIYQGVVLECFRPQSTVELK
jgi:hypothetical protein